MMCDILDIGEGQDPVGAEDYRLYSDDSVA